MKSKPEIIDLYDHYNQPLGRSVSRDYAHAEGLWHRTVHIYVTRTSTVGTEVLVHLRSKNKKQYPGTFDPVFGGHVQSGSSEEVTALSELQEEIGISPQKEKLVFHGFVKKNDPEKALGDREFNAIYSFQLSEIEQSQIELDSEEVQSVQWVPLSQLTKLVSESETKWRPSLKELSAGLDALTNTRVD